MKMKIQHENLQHVWDTANVVPRGKFIAIYEYIRKEERPQINNPSSCLRNLEKEYQNQPIVVKEETDEDESRNQ